MRHIARRIAVALTLVGIASTCIVADQIRWAPNIEQARQMAAQQNKLLLIHFWSPMCGPCKTLDAKVFPDSAVGTAINQNFVALKVNAASNEGRELTAHFNIDQVPTDIVSTVGGKALHRMVSSTRPKLYAQKINTLGQQFSKMAQYSPQGQQPQRTMPASNYDNRSMQTATVGSQPPVGMPGISDSQLGATTSALAQNNAVARRPGVNQNPLPSHGLGAQRPGYNASQLGSGNRFSATNDTQTATNTPAQTQPQGSGSRSYSPEINNPYASQTAPPQDTVVTPQATTNQYVAPTQSTPPQLANASRYSSPQNINVSPAATGPALGAAPNFVNPAPQDAPQVATNSQPLDPQLPRPQTLNPMASANPRVASTPRNDGTPIPPSGDSSVGLEGRCPVWLITNGTWKKGDKRWGAVHRGKTYLFSSQEAQQQFLAAPDDYSPVLAGMDIVRLASEGAVAQGTRRYGVLFDDDGSGPRRSRMFLFDSVETRNRFEADPDTFLQPVMQAKESGQLERLIR